MSQLWDKKHINLENCLLYLSSIISQFPHLIHRMVFDFIILKDLFVPTAKIHSHNTRASVSKNFYIQKSNTEIQRKSVSRIGAKLWNEIPTKLRALPKATFKKRIQMILLKILENEDSYKDVEFIISKVNCYFP